MTYDMIIQWKEACSLSSHARSAVYESLMQAVKNVAERDVVLR